jgi:GNAT superfamily N-acetyltransferase
MYDGSAVAAAELRFREDLWRTAPSDAVQEAEVRMQRFGPILATVFADLPNVTLVNMVLGAAEQAAVDGGHLSAAIEWLRSREVDYLVSVSDDRPGTTAAKDWLASRGYVPGSAMRRYLRPATTRVAEGPARVTIRELGALETEGMSHIVANSLELSGLATVLIFGLPEQEGWRCYSARLDGTEVACGSMLTMNKLALLALDATVPEARGNGCQTALIARRLADAARAGCEDVLAEVCDGHPASPSAVANLTRAGFLEIPGATNWGRPTGIA